MNEALVARIADAVLYEGYILYPYRPSVKNRQRWTFGGLYPRAYSEAQCGADAWTMQTECLVAGREGARLQGKVRFLHLQERVAGRLAEPLAKLPPGEEPPCEAVATLQVGDRLYHTWQEAEERSVNLGERSLADLVIEPQRWTFAFPAARRCEALMAPTGEIGGVLVRRQQGVEGVVEVSAERIADELFRVTVRILNETPLADAAGQNRDEALLHSLVSTHTILGVRGGEFVSLTDPPECWRDHAAACHNVGAWPVLVGAEGQTDTLLSSPIILPDYPQVALESPGDLFDGAEIDEILTLRILTLTDEEKRAVAAVDERARALLDRTESLGPEQLWQLHGAVRSLRPLGEDGR